MPLNPLALHSCEARELPHLPCFLAPASPSLFFLSDDHQIVVPCWCMDSFIHPGPWTLSGHDFKGLAILLVDRDIQADLLSQRTATLVAAQGNHTSASVAHLQSGLWV